ncbi:MAG: hypothetical protein JSU04_17610 [Bdellovibrionales bacterium]|nr:hypothetical protein [Bdellovibrionales bacterium]
MKKFAQLAIALTMALALLSAGLWLWVQTNTTGIFIESEESKNPQLESVFNEIRWFPGADRDVWMMNQSHFGRKPPPEKWDRIAIVIDKTKSPKVAYFYQFKPGPLEWNEDLLKQQIPYRASCFLCHNNGPRAIRPMTESSSAPLTLREKIKTAWWNLRIKTYGRVRYDAAEDREDAHREVPFRFRGPPHEDELRVGVCVKCHQNEGLFARGTLQRQQRGTIQHMVEAGHMPPPGFALSQKERSELQDFLHGF